MNFKKDRGFKKDRDSKKDKDFKKDKKKGSFGKSKKFLIED